MNEDVDVGDSFHRYIKFNHKIVNKGKDLLSIAQLLNIKLEDIMIIEDNF